MIMALEIDVIERKNLGERAMELLKIMKHKKI